VVHAVRGVPAPADQNVRRRLADRAAGAVGADIRASASARVFEFLPRFAHTKAVVLDDRLTIIGSANADLRSFRLNFELACVVDAPSLNDQVADILAADMAESRELDVRDRDGAPMAAKLLDSAANLRSPLL